MPAMNNPPATTRSLLHPRDEIMRTMERIYRYRMTHHVRRQSVHSRRERRHLDHARARGQGRAAPRGHRVCPRTAGARGRIRPRPNCHFTARSTRRRPDLGGIVHAHPVALVAFSICGRVPDTRLFPQARHVCGEPGFAPYALPGSAALGESIARTFADGFDCVGAGEPRGRLRGRTCSARSSGSRRSSSRPRRSSRRATSVRSATWTRRRSRAAGSTLASFAPGAAGDEEKDCGASSPTSCDAATASGC